ncbi:MAG: hypothetical protein CM1200mP10_28910 [Candidatus Neomarinimicrobiota bacterium]|nr:MAG: hypothetical protein CM1200mP10_28910 [Candidatus Neomarinimicrobiota bacterium]
MHQTATYVLEEVGKDKGFDYTRSANPTRQMMEEHLAALDSGKYGVAYSSGMAAVDSCLKLLKSGDHVICSDDVTAVYPDISTRFWLIMIYILPMWIRLFLRILKLQSGQKQK